MFFSVYVDRLLEQCLSSKYDCFDGCRQEDISGMDYDRTKRFFNVRC